MFSETMLSGILPIPPKSTGYWADKNMLENKSWIGKSSIIYALIALQTSQAKVLFSLLFLLGTKQNRCSLTCQKTERKQHNPKVYMHSKSRHVMVSEDTIWKNLCSLWFLNYKNSEKKFPKDSTLTPHQEKKAHSDSIWEVKYLDQSW